MLKIDTSAKVDNIAYLNYMQKKEQETNYKNLMKNKKTFWKESKARQRKN